jgi:hypothetical protein
MVPVTAGTGVPLAWGLAYEHGCHALEENVVVSKPPSAIASVAIGAGVGDGVGTGVALGVGVGVAVCIVTPASGLFDEELLPLVLQAAMATAASA